MNPLLIGGLGLLAMLGLSKKRFSPEAPDVERLQSVTGKSGTAWNVLDVDPKRTGKERAARYVVYDMMMKPILMYVDTLEPKDRRVVELYGGTDAQQDIVVSDFGLR